MHQKERAVLVRHPVHGNSRPCRQPPGCFCNKSERCRGVRPPASSVKSNVGKDNLRGTRNLRTHPRLWKATWGRRAGFGPVSWSADGDSELAFTRQSYLGGIPLAPSGAVVALLTGATGTAAGAWPLRRISAAISLMSVRSRCISLQPYHNA
jgi:hypothetical protein